MMKKFVRFSMTQLGRSALSIAASLALAGCMVAINEKHPYKDGWRYAKFIGLVKDGIPDVHVSIDCRPQSESPKADGKTYVLVANRIRNGRWFFVTHYWIVPAENAEALRTNNLLYANPKNCSLSAVLADDIHSETRGN
jgi:hypothetical protein